MSTISISAADQQKLHALWQEAFAWIGAANGFVPAYRSPVARLLARDVAHSSLNRYFDCIDQLINRKALPTP